MRPSRTFRPAVDGLESRKLLAGPYSPLHDADFLNGAVSGSWRTANALNPNAFQTQTLSSNGAQHIDYYDFGGDKNPHGFEVRVDSSSLVMPPLSKGGTVVGTLNLTLTVHALFVVKYDVYEKVRLPVVGHVENAAHDSFQFIQGRLVFPTTHRNVVDAIGGWEHGEGERLYFTETVNPENPSSGSFQLDFQAPRT
jgi:hypothetical protein